MTLLVDSGVDIIIISDGWKNDKWRNYSPLNKTKNEHKKRLRLESGFLDFFLFALNRKWRI